MCDRVLFVLPDYRGVFDKCRQLVNTVVSRHSGFEGTVKNLRYKVNRMLFGANISYTLLRAELSKIALNN